MGSRARWSLDGLYVWDNTIIGSVSQGASGDWFAYGCEDEWEDSPLGSFDSELQARKVVEQWVKEINNALL